MRCTFGLPVDYEAFPVGLLVSDLYASSATDRPERYVLVFHNCGNRHFGTCNPSGRAIFVHNDNMASDAE